MRSKRPLARQCKHLAKQYVDDPDEPAAPDGDSGFADWVQIAVMLMRDELDKSLRESEAWFVIEMDINLDLETPLCASLVADEELGPRADDENNG